MKALSGRWSPEVPQELPRLENGDHLTQPEFHRRYRDYPEDVKAELIGGIVYMAAALRRPHATYHPELIGALWVYKAATPGVELLDSATIILGKGTEVQPDLALRLLPEWGGQSSTNPEGYITGAAELMAEVSHSTLSLDMNKKKVDYQRAGVREYIVLCIEEKELYWFDFRLGRPIKPNRRGIMRSHVFPGLWIDPRAMMDRDSSRIMAVAQQGVASREHAAFVKRLQAAHRRRARG